MEFIVNHRYTRFCWYRPALFCATNRIMYKNNEIYVRCPKYSSQFYPELKLANGKWRESVKFDRRFKREERGYWIFANAHIYVYFFQVCKVVMIAFLSRSIRQVIWKLSDSPYVYIILIFSICVLLGASNGARVVEYQPPQGSSSREAFEVHRR